MNYTDHPQVDFNFGEVSFLCDEKLAPTLLALWKAGLVTQFSCQGDYAKRKISRPSERSYILLEHNEPADNFISFLKANHEGFAETKIHLWGPEHQQDRNMRREVRRREYNFEQDFYDLAPRFCIRYPFRELGRVEGLACDFAENL